MVPEPQGRVVPYTPAHSQLTISSQSGNDVKKPIPDVSYWTSILFNWRELIPGTANVVTNQWASEATNPEENLLLPFF